MKPATSNLACNWGYFAKAHHKFHWKKKRGTPLAQWVGGTSRNLGIPL